MKKQAIIGMGNPLMGDEGIGVRIASRLAESFRGCEELDVLEVGSSGFQALHAMAFRPKVAFVDCAFMGEFPGTMRRFYPYEIVSKKIQPRLSLHEGDLFQTIKLSRQLGECPEKIVVFGVEPAKIQAGDLLSQELNVKLDEYVDRIAQEFEAIASLPSAHMCHA